MLVRTMAEFESEGSRHFRLAREVIGHDQHRGEHVHAVPGMTAPCGASRRWLQGSVSVYIAPEGWGRPVRWAADVAPSVRSPERSSAEMWTKMSSARSSGAMKPKPLVVLNHLTVPGWHGRRLLSGVAGMWMVAGRVWWGALRPSWLFSARSRGR